VKIPVAGLKAWAGRQQNVKTKTGRRPQNQNKKLKTYEEETKKKTSKN